MDVGPQNGTVLLSSQTSKITSKQPFRLVRALGSSIALHCQSTASRALLHIMGRMSLRSKVPGSNFCDSMTKRNDNADLMF
jgi:hypothetical protein